MCKYQCCRSEMFIPGPGSEFFHPGSRIQGQKYSGSRIRIRIKEFKYFKTKILFLSSRKYYPGCSTWIPDPDLDFCPYLIPDPGVKRAPDPGSATLVDTMRSCSCGSLGVLTPVTGWLGGCYPRRFKLTSRKLTWKYYMRTCPLH
jgi:hypothetical protein